MPAPQGKNDPDWLETGQKTRSKPLQNGEFSWFSNPATVLDP
jgi:hypothetical protein